MRLRPVITAALVAAAMSASAASPPANPASFKGSLTGPMSAASVTSVDIDIGTPAADRRVFVTVNAFAAAASLVGLKIGGVAATQHVGTAGASSRLMAIYSAIVPSGPTAAIELTLDATGQRYTFGVWVEDNSVSSTPYDTTAIVSLTNTAASLPGGFDVPTNGFAIAVSWHNSSAAGGETAWSQNVGVANERLDRQANGTGQWCTAADTFQSGTGIVMTATNTQAAALIQLVAISWAH